VSKQFPYEDVADFHNFVVKRDQAQGGLVAPVGDSCGDALLDS
jgi:hypothetical protein